MNYTMTIMEFGSDGLLDFYLIGGMQCVVLNRKNLVGKMIIAAFLKDLF